LGKLLLKLCEKKHGGKIAYNSIEVQHYINGRVYETFEVSNIISNFKVIEVIKNEAI